GVELGWVSSVGKCAGFDGPMFEGRTLRSAANGGLDVVRAGTSMIGRSVKDGVRGHWRPWPSDQVKRVRLSRGASPPGLGPRRTMRVAGVAVRATSRRA